VVKLAEAKKGSVLLPNCWKVEPGQHASAD
jgi:hypothetical protein